MDGKVYLLEIKDGSNPSGIYLSVFQIGLYLKLFERMQEEGDQLRSTLVRMAEQKERIGLIKSTGFVDRFRGSSSTLTFVPQLIIGGFKQKSSAMQKAHEVNEYMKKENPSWSFVNQIEYFSYNRDDQLQPLDLSNYK
ncbi:MAG TPA: hypothetical protein ENH10_05925 [Bacteroidetes bacterium]|nr:hypothetical protein [Bacteroidota bacterium]HEX04682.1 hypothetical protein [Bacteroidota bacterium]